MSSQSEIETGLFYFFPFLVRKGSWLSHLTLVMDHGELRMSFHVSIKQQYLYSWSLFYHTGLLIFRGKKRKISRDFRGKKVKTCGKIGRFRRIFAGKSQNSRKNPPISREKSQNSQENRPISRHFSGKSQISKDFQGQIHRKIGRFHGETSPRNNQ